MLGRGRRGALIQVKAAGIHFSTHLAWPQAPSRLMASFSTTGGGSACCSRASIARPTRSVLVSSAGAVQAGIERRQSIRSIRCRRSAGYACEMLASEIEDQHGAQRLRRAAAPMLRGVAIPGTAARPAEHARRPQSGSRYSTRPLGPGGPPRKLRAMARSRGPTVPSPSRSPSGSAVPSTLRR